MTPAQDGIQTIYIVGPLLVAFFALILVLVMRARRRSTIVVDRERVVGAAANWRAPDGLANASLPRAVKLSGTSWLLFGMLALLLGGAGFMGWIASRAVSRNEQETQLLQREGVVVQGTVVRKWIGGGKARPRNIEYQYTASDGQHTAKSTVLRTLYDRVETGSNVRITYAQSNPSINAIESRYAASPIAPVFVFLIPLVVILIAPVAMLRQKKLLEYGTPAAAVIERVSPMKGGWMIAYQFLDANGDTVKGRCSSSVKPTAGEVVTVIYDPERPKYSARYPLKFVKLEDSL